MLTRLTLFTLFVLTSVTLSAQTLTLEAYLKECSEKNEALAALRSSSTGSGLRAASEKDLLTSPAAFANYMLLDDSKQTMNPSFMGTRTVANVFSIGVQKQTSFGLTARLSYGLNYTSLYGVSPLFIPEPQFYEARPALEITQSLWRNGWGSELQAQQTLIEAQTKLSHFADNLKGRMLLAEGEMNFLRLQVAREVVRVQKQSYGRAEQMREWSAGRVKMLLADKTDLLQAEAAEQGRALELQTAIDEERSAAQTFNSFRNVESPVVGETLPALDESAAAEYTVPATVPRRADVDVAEQQQRLVTAASDVGQEKTRPSLDLTGLLALNGRSPSVGTAMGDSVGTSYPTWGVGFKFMAPLDLGGASDVRSGYVQEEKAAELNFRRKQLESRVEWDDLVKKYGEAKFRLELARKLEKAQSTKLEYERDRLKKGRSVTYQVLLFENDFATAQLARIRSVAECLRVIALMKTFGNPS